MASGSYIQKENRGAFLFILPNFLGFLLFTSLPVVASMVISFTSWDVFTPPRFIGIQNYVDLLSFHPIQVDARPGFGDRALLALFLFLCTLLPTAACFTIYNYIKERKKAAVWLFSIMIVAGLILIPVSRSALAVWTPNDPRFWYYCFNTLYLMLAIPVAMFSSLLLAIVLNQKLPGIYFFRLVYYLPTICTGVGIYILWMYIYNPDYGLINTVLRTAFHTEGPKWLQDIVWAKPALMIMGFWGAVGGFNCVLYLAALQGIPQDLYEAADIDGASWWQKFWTIIWPLVSPTTFYIFIMSVIGGFQSGFDMAYVMTGGGPAGSTTTISFYIYDQAFRNFEMGYASAISWVLFVLVFGVTILNYRIGGKVVHY